MLQKKDHVTPTTEVMTAAKLHFKIFHNIVVFTVFFKQMQSC